MASNPDREPTKPETDSLPPTFSIESLRKTVPKTIGLVAGLDLSLVDGEKSCQNAITQANDEALLRQFLFSSRQEALNELFLRHMPGAYGLALRLLGNEADAHDAVQNGFTRAFTHLDQFQGHSSFRTWLFQIIRHAAADIRERRSRHAGADLHSLLSLADPQDLLAAVEWKDLLALLETAVQPEELAAFRLVYLEGYKRYEAADLLGCAAHTVFNRLRAVKETLRQL